MNGREKRLAIAAMRAEGQTYRRIAAALGISMQRVMQLHSTPLKDQPTGNPCATCGNPIPEGSRRYCRPRCRPGRQPTGRPVGRPRRTPDEIPHAGP